MRDRPGPSDYSYGTSYSSYKSSSWKPNREKLNIERKKSSIERSDIERKKSDFQSDLLRSPTVGYQYTEDGYTYWVVEENERGSETIHKMTRSTPFYVQDETGRLRVDITGGEIESVVVVDEQTNAPSNILTINYGTFSMSLANYSAASSKGYRKPRRFNYKESLLPLDTFVTITGQVASEGGEAVIRKPQAGGQLLVSLQSGNELLEKKKNEGQASLGGSAISLVIGIICLMIAWSR
ncbi:E3 ubiquitin ligase family protein [Synechococcus sp. Nb3U1]|uniref:E3 ubiquitin ligase family protein n=1 Tax=Synechococcus sp. Nb3U1 TaxID=1914529 RepID=UPI001F4223CA|nr:E3 ubiquitin ligase family protein [Synechococcus sp. Nb3U1]MCF2970170.1 E3 ubiquitin ligase family protein [Synechococcus sp. Nb3U1]